MHGQYKAAVPKFPLSTDFCPWRTPCNESLDNAKCRRARSVEHPVSCIVDLNSKCDYNSGEETVVDRPAVDHRSPPDAKVTLFRSLFRGRDDVYPRRFESRRSGKSGYSPVCGNEWVRGICEKPRVKCAVCPHRHFLPVTAEMIRWHLSGHDDRGSAFVAGVYPMLLDETCCFLAMDFDKTGWQQDARAMLETCRRIELPVALERSRSGNGGHVWLFFEDPIPAVLARRLGAHILTETMEYRPEIGLDSYDRFFPNQDTLPQGGFGNLIALPLQKAARHHGNSVFVDDGYEPHVDQWAFLSSLDRISETRVEQIVQDAKLRKRIVGVRIAPLEDDAAPWKTPPSGRGARPAIGGQLPSTLEITLLLHKDGVGRVSRPVLYST
ncbi:MAG: TOTE conflict system archaeo-eukaryotic primase domain-containing protein [Planctomycetota bacterium]